MNYKTLATGAAASLILCSTSLTTYADTLGFRLGAYSWMQNYDGTIQSSNSGLDKIDITDDLGFDEESDNTIYAVLEHPFPLIPNIKIQKTDLQITETNSPGNNFLFDGDSYLNTDKITSTSDLSHTDATVYYEILDNWISIDLGITARRFTDGFELYTDEGKKSSLDIDSTIPLLYVAAKVELPLTGLYVDAELNGIGYGDTSLTDYKISLGYETDLGLGIEAGVRNIELDYDDGDEEADLSIDGAFIGVFYHF